MSEKSQGFYYWATFEDCCQTSRAPPLRSLFSDVTKWTYLVAVVAVTQTARFRRHDRGEGYRGGTKYAALIPWSKIGYANIASHIAA